MKHDFYRILGVPPTASQGEIHAAFRDLSKGYHPDVNPGGRQVFEEIKEAYSALSNLDKRAEYDRKIGIPTPAPAFASAGIMGMRKKA